MILKRSKRIGINTFFKAVLLFTVSLGVSIYLLYDTAQPVEYRFLPALPLCYAFLSIFFCNLFCRTANVGIKAVLFLEFFRLVITPLILSLGDYYSVMYRTRTQHLTSAIALMVYEALCVFIVVDLVYRKDTHKAMNNSPRIKQNTLKYILTAMIIFLVFVAVFFPGSVTAFKSIFDMVSDDFSTWAGSSVSSRYSVGTIGRILGTLFTMVFSWVRYLLPVGVIIWCKKRISNETVALMLSMIPIVLQMMFITATIMDGILCAFVLLLVLGKVYPQKRRLLLGLSVGAFFAVIGFYFFSRYLIRGGSGGNPWKFISENAIAYVGGIDNVAAMMNVPDAPKWSTYFFNVYGAIPFNSTLFGLSGEKLAAVFNAANGRRDGHIPPTIGAGWYYYGPILAPIESMIYARLACKFGSKAAAQKNIWKYCAYTLTSIMMAMGFTTYNSAIVLNYVTTLLIPFVVLCKYTNDLEFMLFEK